MPCKFQDLSETREFGLLPEPCCFLLFSEPHTRKECLSFDKDTTASRWGHSSKDQDWLSLLPHHTITSYWGLKLSSEPLSVCLQSQQVLKGKSQPDVDDQERRKVSSSDDLINQWDLLQALKPELTILTFPLQMQSTAPRQGFLFFWQPNISN